MTQHGGNITPFIVKLFKEFGILKRDPSHKLLAAHVGQLECFNKKITKMMVEFFFNGDDLLLHFSQGMSS